MAETSLQYWTTTEECNFIDGIGIPRGEAGSNIPSNCPHLFLTASRKEKVGMYIKTLESRAKWGQLDKRRVIEYAGRVYEGME